jgi:hypothetical protein
MNTLGLTLAMILFLPIDRMVCPGGRRMQERSDSPSHHIAATLIAC